jgi:hypothetical protein
MLRCKRFYTYPAMRPQAARIASRKPWREGFVVGLSKRVTQALARLVPRRAPRIMRLLAFLLKALRDYRLMSGNTSLQKVDGFPPDS